MVKFTIFTMKLPSLLRSSWQWVEKQNTMDTCDINRVREKKIDFIKSGKSSVFTVQHAVEFELPKVNINASAGQPTGKRTYYVKTKRPDEDEINENGWKTQKIAEWIGGFDRALKRTHAQNRRYLRASSPCRTGSQHYSICQRAFSFGL